jgi:hypothetical protein
MEDYDYQKAKENVLRKTDIRMVGETIKGKQAT